MAFPLNPVTNSLIDFLDICYSDNINTWMKNGECWNYDILFSDSCFQYQFEFYCIDQRYCALTANLPAEITCPSIGVLFCRVYSSEMN